MNPDNASFLALVVAGFVWHVRRDPAMRALRADLRWERHVARQQRHDAREAAEHERKHLASIGRLIAASDYTDAADMLDRYRAGTVHDLGKVEQVEARLIAAWRADPDGQAQRQRQTA